MTGRRPPMIAAAGVLAATLAVGADSSAPARAAPGLLVVGPRALLAALDDYLAFRGAEMPVATLALEDALAAHDGADDAERLKRALFDAWRARSAGYVLLVGDASVVPVRYMTLDRKTEAAFNQAFYPSDLYYADVAEADGSFEDWNAARAGHHAGYHGEVCGEHGKDGPIDRDEVHYLPELAVGRWPVHDAAEAAIVAAKTIAWERGRAARGADAASAGLLVMTDGWVDARGRLDLAAAPLAPEWSLARLYYADDARPGETTPTEAGIVAAMNGGVDLVVHAGHGFDDGWDRCLSVRSIAQLTNADRPCVVLSAGCSTARFATLPPYEAYEDVHGVEHAGTNDGEVFTAPPPPPAVYARGAHDRTGLGERLLRDGPTGAVAYIGCNTGSQPCALTLVDGFLAAVARGEPRLGDCWNATIRHYHAAERLADLVPDDGWYPPSVFFQGMKFMVFGDPTLRLGAR